MKKFVLGLICGVGLTATTAVYASDTIQAYLFSAKFVFNGQNKELDSEYTILNYNGHAYVPIRFVAENMGATVRYDDELKKITVNATSPSLVPNYKGEMIQIDRPYVLKIRMTDNDNGWAESDGMVIRTTDGGKTWLKATPKELFLYGISSGLMIQSYFFSGNHAWIARPAMLTRNETEGTVWRTENCGLTWFRAILPTMDGWEQNATYFIDFPDLMHGYLVASAGDKDHPQKSIFTTTNGGVSWVRDSEITGQIKNLIKGIHFRNVNEGWISTLTIDHTNSLYKTINGGKTWDPVYVDIPKNYEDVVYSAPETPVFFGENKLEAVMSVQLEMSHSIATLIYETHDGGTSWTFAGEAPVISPTQIQFIDSKHAYALVNSQNNNKLYVTSDGGKMWSLKSEIMIPIINEWKFNNLLDGWVTSTDPGDLYATHDGGVSWTQIKPKQ